MPRRVFDDTKNISHAIFLLVKSAAMLWISVIDHNCFAYSPEATYWCRKQVFFVAHKWQLYGEVCTTKSVQFMEKRHVLQS